MFNIAEHRENYRNAARPLSQLVPWRFFWSERLIFGKDGSFLACFQFDGLDVDNVQEATVDRLAYLIEAGTRLFNERITIWSRVDRRRTFDYPESRFPDPVSQMIDDERRTEFMSGNQYVNRHYVAILYKATQEGANGFFDNLGHLMNGEGKSFLAAFVEASKRSYSKKTHINLDQHRLDREAALFEDLLSGFEQTITDLHLMRLSGDDLLSTLHAWACPASAGQSVRPSMLGARRLDRWLADNTLYTGHDTLLFENVHNTFVTAVSVKEWPEWTQPGLLNDLLAVPGEITLSQCFRFLPENEARDYIDSVQKHNLNSQKSFGTIMGEAISNTPSDRVDEGKLQMAGEASEAKAVISAERKVYGHYNLTVLAYGVTETESHDTLAWATQALRGVGYVVVRETMHLLSAWAGTMPGQWGEIVRWHFIQNANVADLFPMLTLEEGDIDNPVLTEQTSRPSEAMTVFSTMYSTPYYFSFHATDVAHTLVVGPTGAGKSLVMNFLMSQFRKYSPCNIYIFDKDRSCRIPTLLQGGSHIDLSGETARVRMNPMKFIGDRDNWIWLAKWIEMLLCSRGYVFKTGDDETVWHALENVADSAPKLWRLRSLHSHLGHLSEHLSPWVWDGPLSVYFDNEEDDLNLGDFTCAEMGGIFRDERLASAFMDYAFFVINKKLDGTPTLIYIEEAWFMLANSAFAAKVEDWLKTLRKKHAFVIMTTQSLKDLAESQIFAAILDNVPNRIFLPNERAQVHAELYANFGLTDEQIAMVQNASPKRDYLIVTPKMARLASLVLNSRIVSALTGSIRAQKIFDKHYATPEERRDSWQWDYLEEMAT